MSGTEYQTEFNNNVKVIGSVSGVDTDVNNASLQVNTLGVNDTAVIRNLKVQENTLLQTISVSGNGSVTGSFSVGETLSTNDASVGGALTVTNNATVGGTLGVTSDATVGGTLGVTSNATVGGTLGVTSDATVGGTLGVTSNATVGGTLGVTSDATVGGTLGVTSDATVGGVLAVTSNATVGGTLGVTSDATVGGSLTVSGDLIVDGNFSNNLDKVYTVSFADTDDLKTVVAFNNNYAYGAFIIIIDETDSTYTLSANDGAAAIFCSCVKIGTLSANRLSGVNGANTGKIDIVWTASGENLALGLSMTRAESDTNSYYFSVRVLSPTKLL
jgi:predicted acyltransferase (DUF342 family)